MMMQGQDVSPTPRWRRWQPSCRAWLFALFFVGCVGLIHCDTQTTPSERSIENPSGDAGALEQPVVDVPPPLREVCANDIEGDYAKLPKDGALLAFGEGSAFQGKAEYQYAFHGENQFGVQNHFQGVVRWGRHLYVTGGDLKILEAHLFVIELGSRPFTGVWGSNVGAPDAAPPASDVIQKKLNIIKDNHWHAGGIARYDNILVVPLENNQTSAGKRGSTIVFYDLSVPGTPKEMPISIRSDAVAYAAGLTRVRKDGPYLMARWNDKTLVFYTSKSNVIKDGFDTEKTATWSTKALVLREGLTEVGGKGMNGQSVSLLTQCDGAMYALLNDNTNRLPTKQGTHYLDLYRIVFPGGDTRKVPTIEKIGSRGFSCPEQRCNFTGAGGTHVDSKGRLVFYSVPLFRDLANRRMTAVEFAPK